MIQILVTGADGFLGRNLTVRMKTLSGVQVMGIDVHTTDVERNEALRRSAVIFHLAGVNRPDDPAEFGKVNRDLTAEICAKLKEFGKSPKIVFSSSTQAGLDNPYGKSKREAEEALLSFGADTGAAIRIYRLRNVFGKWSRPNYNSVVATFCHNIANDRPIEILDASRELELVYVDDVVDSFMAELSIHAMSNSHREIPFSKITLGELAARIQSFHGMCHTLLVPDFAVPLNRQLYATYLSYVPYQACRQQLSIKSDERGRLAEFLKSTPFGQVFVSRTRPGVTRGNHYHHTKAEKVLVVGGEGIIRMRQIDSTVVLEFKVHCDELQVIDIPPGYTHSIENSGAEDMVSLFWASEVFDPDRPDTSYLPVLTPAESQVAVSA